MKCYSSVKCYLGCWKHFYPNEFKLEILICEDKNYIVDKILTFIWLDVGAFVLSQLQNDNKGIKSYANN